MMNETNGFDIIGIKKEQEYIYQKFEGKVFVMCKKREMIQIIMNRLNDKSNLIIKIRPREDLWK